MPPNHLPYRKKPCSQCPLRTDALKGWLGDRMVEILKQGSFVCHKNTNLQCAGHMILKDQENTFVQIAERLGVVLELKGKNLGY